MIRHVNPESMHSNPAFSQGVVVEGPHRTVYVGGQNAVDAGGAIVGRGDLAAQATQVARNARTVLEEAGAAVEHVVQWTVCVVQPEAPDAQAAAERRQQALGAALVGFQRELGMASPPPTVNVLFVAGLAHPDFLLEVSAIAVVPLAD